MIHTDITQHAQDKRGAYRAETERRGQLAEQGAKQGWRSQTARVLRNLAEQLEPSPTPQPSRV